MLGSGRLSRHKWIAASWKFVCAKEIQGPFSPTHRSIRWNWVAEHPLSPRRSARPPSIADSEQRNPACSRRSCRRTGPRSGRPAVQRGVAGAPLPRALVVEKHQAGALALPVGQPAGVVHGAVEAIDLGVVRVLGQDGALARAVCLRHRKEVRPRRTCGGRDLEAIVRVVATGRGPSARNAGCPARAESARRSRNLGRPLALSDAAPTTEIARVSSWARTRLVRSRSPSLSPEGTLVEPLQFSRGPLGRLRYGRLCAIVSAVPQEDASFEPSGRRGASGWLDAEPRPSNKARRLPLRTMRFSTCAIRSRLAQSDRGAP